MINLEQKADDQCEKIKSTKQQTQTNIWTAKPAEPDENTENRKLKLNSVLNYRTLCKNVNLYITFTKGELFLSIK